MSGKGFILYLQCDTCSCQLPQMSLMFSVCSTKHDSNNYRKSWLMLLNDNEKFFPGNISQNSSLTKYLLCWNDFSELLLPFQTCSSRVRPSIKPHTLCDADADPDGGFPLLPGVPDNYWLWFPLHHWGMSSCHHPPHHPAGHHHADGDLHHWYLPGQGSQNIKQPAAKWDTVKTENFFLYRSIQWSKS